MYLRLGGLRCAAVSLFSILLFSGCVKSRTLVKVNPDGSGNIVITRTFSKEMISMIEAQMSELKKTMGAAAGAAGAGKEAEDMLKDPFYNEETLKNEAGQYGECKFEKATRYDKDGVRGSIAAYSFSNINNIFFNMDNKNGPMGMNADPMGRRQLEKAERGEKAISFKITTGSVARLTIVIPAEIAEATNNPIAGITMEEKDIANMRSQMAPAEMMKNGNPMGLSGKETPDEIMKKMLGGMESVFEVEFNNKIVKSNASHVNKTRSNKITLIDLNMSRVTQSKDFLKIMKASETGGPDGMTDVLMAIPGTIHETKKEVTVEFKKEVTSK